MTDNLRILAVDDEPLALADLASLLRGHRNVAEVMTATSSSAALQVLSRENVDVLFLDVRMPDIDGVELARVVRRFGTPPVLVFVSAYESAAVEAFELRATDYLMKPVTSQRLAQALERVVVDAWSEGSRRAGPADEPGIDPGSDLIAVDMPRGNGVRLLPRSAILYVQAYGDYQRVFSTEGRFLLRARMASLESSWAPDDFVRVHRQFMVNLRQATAVRRRGDGASFVAFADGSEVPIARRHVAELRRRLSR
jgi:DNA-binding LytR/AlgR family response regulator